MNNDGILFLGAAIVGFLLYGFSQKNDDEQGEDMIDAARTALDEAMGGRSQVEDMETSENMLSMLSRRERYSAKPYKLNDGVGLTWGYGHKGQNGEVAPDYISRPDAYELFRDDVIRRAEKWVKLFVEVDLVQPEFDALVSIAFNMSPQSFKKFAAEVNAGNGINDIANESINWVHSDYTNGIRNRRNEEMRVFNTGVYA